MVLSAQCTDRRVNIVTRSLFARLPDATTMAAAGEDVIRGLIASISYPNAKARHLAGMKIVVKIHKSFYLLFKSTFCVEKRKMFNS